MKKTLIKEQIRCVKDYYENYSIDKETRDALIYALENAETNHDVNIVMAYARRAAIDKQEIPKEYLKNKEKAEEREDEERDV